MKETIIAILKIVAPLSVALMVFAQGLKIPPRQVAAFFMERPALLLRSLFAVLVVVPAVALAIILMLQPSPEVALGLAIIVVCPPAPLMIKDVTQVGKGDAAFMASMHLSLALLAFITVPIGLYLISIPLGFQAYVDLESMGSILGKTIIIPLAMGLLVRYFFRNFADAAGSKFDRAGTIGLLIVILFALAAFIPKLFDLGLFSYLVIAAVSISALATGHFFGPQDPHQRTALAVESGVRHPVLAITIASANLTPEKALPVMVPCVLIFIFIGVVYLLIRKKKMAAATPAEVSA